VLPHAGDRPNGKVARANHEAQITNQIAGPSGDARFRRISYQYWQSNDKC